jgi:hypothetical protein
MKIKYQVCWGMKSLHHNQFENIEFNPTFFKSKKKAIKWMIDNDDSSSVYVSFFIIEVFN